MRRPTIVRPRKLGFNMTPMIDVVFLLIIFFLVSSHLAKQETRLKLELPVAQSGDEDPLSDSPRITINIQEDGSMTFAGRPLVDQDLGNRLADATRQWGEDVEVRIRCSRLVPYGLVEPIMLACTKNGVWNVSYAVYREAH